MKYELRENVSNPLEDILLNASWNECLLNMTFVYCKGLVCYEMKDFKFLGMFSVYLPRISQKILPQNLWVKS